MPPTAGLPGVADTGLAPFVSQLRRESGWTFWLGILGSTALFVVSPIFTVWLPVPSFLLSSRLLDQHATRLATSRSYLARQAMILLKSAAGMCWGSDPAVRKIFALEPYAAEPGTWRT